MNLDDRIRTIDPARDIDDSLAAGERALSTFARIVGNDPTAARPKFSERRRRGWYVAAAAAAAGGLLFVPIPGLSGTAYAGWVATARPATPAEQHSQGTACVNGWSDPGVGAENHHFTVSLVEVRGDYAYTVLGGDDGFEATCLAGTKPGPATGFGFSGPLTQQPSPRGIVTNSVREGEFEAGHAQYEVTGKVGTDVAALTIEAPGVDVHATVRNGRFAAWWPGETSDSLFSRMTAGPPNPDVTLTYRDGTSHRAPIQTYDVSPM